jgi:CRISPR-associated DxTHG motif protein
VQVDILQTLAEGLGRPDDRLYLDITHGLRHLPMLGLLSAFYLQALGHARWTRSSMVPGTAAARPGRRW